MKKIIAVLGYGTKRCISSFSYPSDVINAAYSSALIKAGALPFLVPSTLNKGIIKETVSRIDGILIPGGNDIDPSLYGEKREEYTLDADRKNDLFQMKMLEEAILQKKAVFGICRGCQLINVLFGGTLYQDIRKEKEKAIEHARLDIPEGHAHDVIIEKGSMLYDAEKKERIEVNSLHHQGIKKIGKGLNKTAYSVQDGLVEGIENREMKLFAVQWHPEALVMAKDDASLSLFRLLISLTEK